MKKTLVIQHYPGIGDLIWHIPYMRAIAQQSRNGRISVMVRPSCRAADVLSGETCIDEIIEHDFRRRDRTRGRHDGIIGKLRMVALLKAHHFDRVIIFSDRQRYALISFLAGIPERYGYGFRVSQRLYLSGGPYIAPFGGRGSPVYDEATRMAIAHGFVDSAKTPKINVPVQASIEVERELAGLPAPRYAFAIGASDPEKNWGSPKFLQLASCLMKEGCGVVFVGGPAESDHAHAVYTAENGLPNGSFRIVCQASVMKTAAVLKTCDFTVGNDTGALNLSVACNVPALGLFGKTLPLSHDDLLHGITRDSMDKISVDEVYGRLQNLSRYRIPASA
jgi:heptosyltransferase II